MNKTQLMILVKNNIALLEKQVSGMKTLLKFLDSNYEHLVYNDEERLFLLKKKNEKFDFTYMRRDYFKTYSNTDIISLLENNDFNNGLTWL